MACERTVTLYSQQTHDVLDALARDGATYVKEQYVSRKYGGDAPSFLAAYRWLASRMPQYVPRPEGAELPYWAFRDRKDIERSSDSEVVELCVPVSQAVFFDVLDWTRILQLRYMPQNEKDERAFAQLLQDYSVKREMDVVLTNFYPDLKARVLASWERLFRHHDRIAAGDESGVTGVQAALWKLDRAWMADDGEV